MATASNDNSHDATQGRGDSPADEYAQRALDYTQEQATIKSGEPQVLLSRDITIQELQDAEIPMGNYEPGCQRPMHLVILKGDFDMQGAAPGAISDSVSLSTTYVAYVYSLKTGDLISIKTDSTGAMFREVLGDPTRPDTWSLPPSGVADSPHASSGDSVTVQPVLCEDVHIEGVAYPNSLTHAPNEHIRTKDFADGIKHTARVFAKMGNL